MPDHFQKISSLNLGGIKEDKCLGYFPKVLLTEYVVRLDVKYEGKKGKKGIQDYSKVFDLSHLGNDFEPYLVEKKTGEMNINKNSVSEYSQVAMSIRLLDIHS